MAGDDARKLSQRGLSNRWDSFDEACGALETSIQGLHQAIEGFNLQLKNKNKLVDGLHQGRLGFERSTTTNNRNNHDGGLYQGGPGIGRHRHPHPSPYNSPPYHPPPYQPRHRNQILPLEESDDEELDYGVHHEQPWHEGFSRKEKEGRSYSRDRGHGYNPDRHRQQRYSYHPSTPHQQPHHRHQQFDYYDDYSPPRRVRHPPSIQPQPRQQQRYTSSLLPPISIKNREPEKKKGGEKSKKNFETTIQGGPLKIDNQGVTSSICTLSLKEIPKELQLVERKKTSSEAADEPFTSQVPIESKLHVHEDFKDVNPAEESFIEDVKACLDGYMDMKIAAAAVGWNLDLSSEEHLTSKCNLLNISYCSATEAQVPEEKSLVVVAYNSLGWNRTDFIRIPVNDVDLVVRDPGGNLIKAQFIDMDNTTSRLRDLYAKAYLGLSAQKAPKFWLVFQVSIPPLGWSTYFISKAGSKGKARNVVISTATALANDTVEVGSGPFKIYFSSTSGQLERVINYRTGVDIPIQQSYLWYGASTGDAADPQASGAYIFWPNGAPPTAVSRSVPMNIIRGPLVDEVHQQFSSWIYQVIRLYKDKEHAEIEFTIGLIPTDDGIGEEVITRLTANMATNKTFYTDSNGRDFLKRIRDYREDWNLHVTQPVSGNYYPLTEIIVMVPLAPLQKKVYMSILRRELPTILSCSSASSNHQSLQNIVVQLRKACSHPYLFQWHSFEAKKTSLKSLTSSNIKEGEIEAKKILIDGAHFIEDHHALSLPVGVHLSRPRILFQRKKLDLAIYTFDDCEELKEPR